MRDYAEEAKSLLTNYRRTVERTDSFSKPVRRPSRKHSRDDSFSYKEVNQVLDQAIDHGQPAALVGAILDLGADVNHVQRRSSNLWKKVTRQAHGPERSEVLQKAARKSPADVVQVLAEQADQENLDAALHNAIVRGDLAVVRVLLRGGADPAELHDDFEQAVSRRDKDLVSVLLSAAKLPCQRCRSSGLGVAVQNDDANVLKLLIGRSADVNYNQGEALALAVKAEKLDFIDLLLAGPIAASPETLDFAVGAAVTGTSRRDSKAARNMVETCLRAGSSGPATERLLTEGLVEAARRQSGLLDVLLRFTTPTDPYHTRAIVQAIEAGQKGVLEKMFHYKLSDVALSSALSHAMSVKDSSARLDFVRLVIAAGARGRPVAEALVHATRILKKTSPDPDSKGDTPESRLVDLLLDQGKADVGYNRGEALQVAVRGALVHVVKSFVDRHPSQEALEAALPFAMGLEEPSQMHAVIAVLLRGGLGGKAADQCLVDAVRGGPATKHLVKLLLTKASVNYSAGEALKCAIRKQDLGSFQLILAQHPDDDTLSAALQATFTLSRADREAYFKELLPNLQDDHLGEALHELVREPVPDLDLLQATLGAEPTVPTTSAAFVSAATADHHEARLLQILEVFALKNAQAILSYESTERWGAAHLLLTRYPSSVALVRYLSEIGFDFERTTSCEVFGRDGGGFEDQSFGIEDVSVLLWAMLQTTCRIDSAVIGEIINCDGKPGTRPNCLILYLSA